jgi:AraC-like DNA-binding protein
MKPIPVEQNIDTRSIKPTLIRTYAYNLNKNDWTKGKFPLRMVDTYEFEFIMASEGYMNLEGIRYPLKPGDLCLRKPYEMTMGEPPYACYMISISLLDDDLQKKTHPLYHNDIIDSLPPVLLVKNPKYYELIFQKILDQYIKNEPSSTLLISSLILEIIYAAYQEARQFYLPSSAYSRVIKKAIGFIESKSTEKISLEQIALHIGMSASHFQKVFKETMNVSPHDYLTNHRLTKAKEWLLMTDDSMTDIAYRSGFETNAYFSYVFKQKMGVSPSMYRKMHQKP